MKFKQIEGQNQRIERISPTQLVVGINIAKETHVAQATTFEVSFLLSDISRSKTQLKVMKTMREAKQDLERLLEEYERIVEILEKIEQEVRALLGEIPMAHILSGAGDLKQYAHGRQLLRKAGLRKHVWKAQGADRAFQTGRCYAAKIYVSGYDYPRGNESRLSTVA